MSGEPMTEAGRKWHHEYHANPHAPDPCDGLRLVLRIEAAARKQGYEAAVGDARALRTLSEAATPGPWKPDLMYVVGEVPGGRPGGEVIAECRPTVHRFEYQRDWRHKQGPADAAFLAAAVNYVRAALDRLQAPEEGAG